MALPNDRIGERDCPMDHVYQVEAGKAPAGWWHRPRFADLQRALQAFKVLPEEYDPRVVAYHAGFWSCIPCVTEERRVVALTAALLNGVS